MVEDTEPAQPEDSDIRARMHGAITTAVKHQGNRLKSVAPTAMVAGLVAAALTPIVLPLIGAGGVGIAASGLVGLLGSTGGGYISDFIKDTIDRMRKADHIDHATAKESLQEHLERELLRHLESPSEDALAFREGASQLLLAVDGVEAALAGASNDIKAAVAQNFAQLGISFSEFSWMLDQIQSTLAGVRVTQAEALTLQRHQLDLQREQLTKTNLLLYRFSDTPQAAVIPTRTGLGTEVSEDEPIPRQALFLPDNQSGPQMLCPYKGLSPFQPEDADYFFGRSEVVANVAARLAESSFLALVGASGSGKSSLIGAGILPLIWKGALPGSSTWTVVSLTPGAHPLDELAVRLSITLGTSATSLLRELESDERALALALRRAQATNSLDGRVVIVIDQFEELFTLCRDARRRDRFIEVLLTTAPGYGDDQVLVIIALRADFYAECAAYPRLSATLQDNHVLVAGMGKAALVEAIVEPARSVGLTLESGLVDAILQDVGGEPGALPLLSHALSETWARREGRRLTLRSYNESGGVRKSIATTAEGVYAALTTEERQAAKNLLLRLTEVGEVTYSRRRVHRSELTSNRAEESTLTAVLGEFVNARLIIANEDTVEVAHEALIREWPRLQEWLSEDRQGLLLHRHLTEAAEGWAALMQDSGELYRGARLAVVSEWAEEHNSRLNDLEREFLRASQAAHRNELESVRRRNRQLRGLALALSLLVIVTILAARVAQTQRSNADKQTRLATSRQYVAEADLNRTRNMALALSRNLRALSIADTPEARRSLTLTIQSHPQVLAILPGVATQRSVDFSPDGRTLAFAAADNSVRFWDLRRHQQIGRPLYGHTDLVVHLAFSGDGRLLASASADGTVRIWDVKKQRQSGAPLDARARGVYSIVFSPSSRLIASGHQDGTIRLWNLESRQAIGRVAAVRQGAVRSMCFSSDARVIASVGDDTGVYLWEFNKNLHQGRQFLSGATFLSPGKQVTSVACLPHRQVLAAGYQGGQIRLWDIETRRQVGATFTGHTDAVRDLVISADGSSMLSGSADSTIRLWRIRDHGQQSPFLTAQTGGVAGVALNKDGRIAVSSGQDGTAIVWDIARTDALEAALRGHKGYIHDIAYDRNGNLLASGGQDGTVRIWDVHQSQEVGPPLVGHAGRVAEVAFSPDGKTLASGGFDGTVRLWDADRKVGIGVLTSVPTGVITGIVFSRDGRLIAASSVNGGVQIWDVRSGLHLDAPPIKGMITAIAMSPDSRMLVTTDGQKLVRTWDIETRREVGAPFVARNVRSLAISPDGRVLAAGTYEGIIATWDVSSRKPTGILEGHAGPIWGLDFRFDSQLLASSSADGTVRLWDMTSLRNSAVFLASGGSSDVAFSPDGQTVATGGNGGAVRIWPTDIARWREAACNLLSNFLENSPTVLQDDRGLCRK